MKTIIHTRSARRLADVQTPVGLYLKVRDMYPESVLLESSDFHGGEDSLSFIGMDPISRFEVKDGVISLQYPGRKTEVVKYPSDPALSVTEALNEFIHSFEQQTNDNPSGINGFFGYTSYDSARYFGNTHPDGKSSDVPDIPDMVYLYYRYILVLNHFKNEFTLVENLRDGEPSRMDEVLHLLENRNYASYNFVPSGGVTSPITDEEYLGMVRRGIEHCQRGDISQIVLSRCFSQDFSGDDFKVYRSLRSINPSPYLFYFDFGSYRIFGSSPKTHCRVSNDQAHVYVMAGAIERTGDNEQDETLAEQLFKDPRENAEHFTLVDLARSDLSRNISCVKLDSYREIQYYSHVIQLCSIVSGNVEPGSNSIRIFADTFPAGILSGAPKIRAMELIHEIENHRRGCYGGCIGYIGLNGDLNQAITIRSFLSKDNRLYYQAGTGIANQSHPETGLKEVNARLGTLKKAIDMAARLEN